MSRAYRISLSRSTRRRIRVDDGVQTTIELLPILPAARMTELLALELVAEGFERVADEPRLLTRRSEDGVEVTLDLAAGTVTARISAATEIELATHGSAPVADPDDVAADSQALADRLDRRLEKMAGHERQRLRREATRKLEQKLTDLQARVDAAVNRASAAALKEKAAQLGEIEEVSEDEQTGSLTIRVRV